MRFSTFFLIIFIATVALWASQSIATDEVYRWVDENGVVHFGDRPPENTAAEQIAIQPGASNDAMAPSETAPAYPDQALTPQPSVAQQIRDERAKKRAETAENEEIVAEACAQRRTLVSQLEPSTRVMVRMEDGEVTRLDDNVRLETLNEAKTYIAENCNK